MIRRYGLDWDESQWTSLEIEKRFIQSGGYITMNRNRYGEGLFHHYRELQSIIWPEGEDHHRWSDLMLKTILDNRITCLSGARDSGKTHIIGRYGLTDYFVFPLTTLILISSTDLRGLELRVWGDLKDMHRRAKERHPNLPGVALESKHGIFSDELNEETPIRDIRRGIICVPCLDRRGSWVGGLEKFVGIKQKRRRVLGDECFPAGTLVDTPNGRIPIENLSPGAQVLCATGIGTIIAIRKTGAEKLVQVNTRDGRYVKCTPEHQFFTQKGWISACNLSEQHYILSAYETMRILREKVSSQDREGSFLQSLLLSEAHSQQAGNEGILFRRTHFGARKKSGMVTETVSSNEARQSDEGRQYQIACFSEAKIVGVETSDSGGKRPWTNEGGNGVPVPISGSKVEFWNQNWEMEWQWVPTSVQSGRGFPRDKTSNRVGRIISHVSGTSGQGHEKGKVPFGAWVESIEVSEHRDARHETQVLRGRGSVVYNLQIREHPSYSVNGLVVHNCQFMHREYLTILSNLDKGDFKGVFVGNPIANLKALDTISEPVEGWANHAEPTTTESFKNRFGGVTVTLVGTDSPNFDGPADEPTRYPYLVDREDEKRVGDRYGRNSEQYYSQIKGVRKEGLMAHRVLTREMCEEGQAFTSAVWSGEDTIKVYGLDAGYGGDRSVAGWAEFGTSVDGHTILRINPPSVIPLQLGADPEDQISLFVKNDCEAQGIPPAHMYFDAGMRATMATSLAKIFGSDVNAINFGGNPTTRPVSADEYITDRQTGMRRLKRCDEHYIKFVTELWFSVRLAVMAKQVREMPKEVAEEFYMREWTKEKGDRYEVETKDETKKRLGMSPDLADWCAIVVEGARRLGFQIENLPDFQGQTKKDDNYLEKELDRYQRERRKRQLNYS